VKFPTRIGKEIFAGKYKITKAVSGANHTLVLAGGKAYAWGDPECC
jgi:alpha-tubulin suppressor-like RCC1 family protein